MEEVEIKQEFDQPQCRACLSVGRNLFPLGKYSNIYKKLTSEFRYLDEDEEQARLCWECVALLLRVTQFQQQAQKANEMLLLGQSYYGSLSHLATVVLNDTHHIIYFSEQTDVKKKKPETGMEIELDTIIGNEDLSDDNCSDNYEGVIGENTIKEEVIEIKLAENIKKSSKPNRWAKKRALQNKKPKFKIITKEELKDIFRRVKIDSEELHRYLERERNSEYYKSKRHKCEKCILGFDSEKSLIRHNKVCHTKEAGHYICDVCQARSPNKNQLSIHIRKHYYKFECTLCGYNCYQEKQSYRHAEKEHRRVFQCLKCELKLGNRREFFRHFKEWHERFTCDYCGISFKMRYCIKDHIRKQHSPFECTPCQKRFARYNGLWLHNKTHHPQGPPAGLDPAPAYCVECDKRYADVYRYRWHLANSVRHTPRKKVRIPCPGCEKVFSKNIYMKDHYNLVHLKQYKYRCEQCDKNFIRNADLVKHRRRVHEGVLPPKNKICYMCGRGFSTNKILMNHVRTHTGERPFSCALCPARFAQRAARDGHTRAAHAHGHGKRAH